MLVEPLLFLPCIPPDASIEMGGVQYPPMALNVCACDAECNEVGTNVNELKTQGVNINLMHQRQKLL